MFLLPLLLQVVFGMSAFASGTITFATALGSMSMKMTARFALRRFGFRIVMIVDAVISAVTIFMCAFLNASMPVVLIFAFLLIAGFFQSLQFTATQAMTYADIEQPQMSTATSIAGMTQQLSRGFGISVVAVILNLSMAWRGASEPRHAGLHDRVRLRGRDGAAVHPVLLAPAARRGVRGQRPPAEDCRLGRVLTNLRCLLRP